MRHYFRDFIGVIRGDTRSLDSYERPMMYPTDTWNGNYHRGPDFR